MKSTIRVVKKILAKKYQEKKCWELNKTQEKENLGRKDNIKIAEERKILRHPEERRLETDI